MQTTLRTEVLGSFNAIEVTVELQTYEGGFIVVLNALRDGEEYNYDDLTADTLEEANAIVDTAMRLKDDLYDFVNGDTRDWLF